MKTAKVGGNNASKGYEFFTSSHCLLINIENESLLNREDAVMNRKWN